MNKPEFRPPRYRPRFRLVTLMVAIMAFGIYFASYRALRAPAFHILGVAESGRPLVKRVPNYRIGGKVSQFVFAPASALDRFVNRDVWEEFDMCGGPATAQTR